MVPARPTSAQCPLPPTNTTSSSGLLTVYVLVLERVSCSPLYYLSKKLICGKNRSSLKTRDTNLISRGS